MAEQQKRSIEEVEVSDGDDDIGPRIEEAVQAKAKKQLKHERLYLSNLPVCEAYEKSYMHRDTITHVKVTPKNDFIITASVDGHIKFWKKTPSSIEFVKHFRTHLGNIQDIDVNSTGTLLVTISNDKSLKVFDVVNFDMINMMKLGYSPISVAWIHSVGDPIAAVAVSDQDTPNIYVYDGKGDETPLHVIEKLHRSPVRLIRYNAPYSTAISIDTNGMLEYWSSPQHDYKFPADRVTFDSKLDTNLYDFAKDKITVHDLSFSKDGEHFVTLSDDRQVRIFRFESGKQIRVYDETLKNLQEAQQTKQILPNMEFGKRMAVEKELEKSDQWQLERACFDSSGYFILYPTCLGVKVLNWYSNKVVRVLAKSENLRVLQVALYQDIPNKPKASITVEMTAADNPNLENLSSDPSAYCTAYKKSRFYIFSNRDPEFASESTGVDRDVFNEKPTRDEILAATEVQDTSERVFTGCTLHTSMGDIHCRLFARECPKSVENFCVHAKNGYYNGHLFHRIIKQFMIQTGDPTGTGTGGESIWGGEFEDEIRPELKHDRPYMLSMANAGPNTNGSQFFITVIPCPWLDGKHTIFGRVTAGMEIAQNISNVRTHPKTDKPYDDVKIISISLKNV